MEELTGKPTSLQSPQTRGGILQDKLEKVLLRPEQKVALQEAVKKAIEFGIKMMD